METYEEFKERRKRQEKYKLSRSNVKDFFIRNQRLVLTGILVIGILIRVAYFLEIQSSPIPHWHNWDATDMNFFDKWGKVISSGNTLTDTVLHPHANWYHLAADNYFTHHFEGESDRFFHLKDLPQKERNEALWNTWLRGKQFHQEPLYAYIIGLIYYLFGSNTMLIFSLQFMTGIFSTLLVYKISERHFGTSTAMIAALLFIFYGPALYFEATLLRTSLIIFMSLALIEGFPRLFNNRNPLIFLFYGFIIGLSILLKSIFLLWAIFLIPVYLLNKNNRNQNHYMSFAQIYMGTLIALLPLMIRNYLVDPNLSLLSISSVGAMGFIQANNDLWQEFLLSPLIPELMKKSNGHFIQSVYYTLLSHESTGSFLEMIFLKIKGILVWEELANNSNYYFGRRISNALRICFINFWWVGPLGFGGLIHYLHSKRKLNTPLLWFLAIHLILLLAFFVNARLRLPLTILLIPFAAYAITSILSGNLKRKKILISSVTILVIFNLFHRKHPESLIRTADYFWAYESYYKDKIADNVKSENWKNAVSIMEDYLESQPKFIDKLLVSNQVSVNNEERQHAGHFANMYLIYAYLKRNSGDESKAARMEKLAGMLKSSAL